MIEKLILIQKILFHPKILVERVLRDAIFPALLWGLKKGGRGGEREKERSVSKEGGKERGGGSSASDTIHLRADILENGSGAFFALKRGLCNKKRLRAWI